MLRSCRLTAQIALLGVLAVLAFPADGSALRGVLIVLTPTGPSPSTLTLPAGLYPIWANRDQIPHTVVFANGLCSFQVAPGDVAACPDGWPDNPRLGEYPYTVDGTLAASIDVVPEGRSITLTANAHRIAPGTKLRLHGELDVPILSPPAPPAPQPVIVLARHDRYHPFRRFRVVTATAHGWHLNWQLRVRPRTRTIYIAEADSQPAGGQYWDRAWSKSFRVAPARP
jgi:hypothetical protein